MKLGMCCVNGGTASVERVCYSRGPLTSQAVMSRKLIGSAQNSVTAMGVGEWCARPGQHRQRDRKLGGKMNILNENFDFQHSANLND